MATSELQAFERSVRADLPEIVDELRSVLGSKLVAFIAGVNETRAVHQWAEAGGRRPSSTVEQRLKLTFRVAELIASNDGDRVAQAWFQGLNPRLEDTSPARVLRDGDLDEAGPRVLAAARSFVGNA
ncbi:MULTISPECIES: hypothetical protein [unclassified Curtobacterium]|uniref:hypothetical protein n=1 Tax=unclassified Curtobacterium TaxID=257496 RepID=UPI000825D825|nr:MULTISPECIES: hypothetical protein [unclassified Curtobacterium]WIA97211.1 hypothetical protein QOL16_02120 [Curtobacterium sp. MCBA15_004]WIB00528.1 hypothetical protein QOL15_02215 [Curtobacterium sp. MCBA15_012]